MFVLCSFLVPHCPANQLACCGLHRASVGLQGIFKNKVPLEIKAVCGQADGAFL